MATVRLNFIAPNENNLESLNIYESSTVDGTFTLIDSTSVIGTYPSYITEYVTTLAVDASDWFAISWVDSENVESELSIPVQGGQLTLVGEILSRLQLRDSSINTQVALQEVLAVIEMVFGTVDVDLTTVSYQQLSGLTNLALARLWKFQFASSSQSASYVAGLVSQKTDSNSARASREAIDALLQDAQSMLGISRSRIAQMADISTTNGTLPTFDPSRLLIEVE